MKTSETCVAQGELQPIGEKLEAPIRLTPEQLETVAAGYLFQPGTIFGVIIRHDPSPEPVKPKRIFGVLPLRWHF
jgi:hypothetical protein